jgi:hypothetical protein
VTVVTLRSRNISASCAISAKRRKASAYTIRLGSARSRSYCDALLDTGALRDLISALVEMDGPEHGRAVVGSYDQVAVYQELGASRHPAAVVSRQFRNAK